MNAKHEEKASGPELTDVIAALVEQQKATAEVLRSLTRPGAGQPEFTREMIERMNAKPPELETIERKCEFVGEASEGFSYRVTFTARFRRTKGTDEPWLYCGVDYPTADFSDFDTQCTAMLTEQIQSQLSEAARRHDPKTRDELLAKLQTAAGLGAGNPGVPFRRAMQAVRGIGNALTGKAMDRVGGSIRFVDERAAAE